MPSSIPNSPSSPVLRHQPGASNRRRSRPQPASGSKGVGRLTQYPFHRAPTVRYQGWPSARKPLLLLDRMRVSSTTFRHAPAWHLLARPGFCGSRVLFCLECQSFPVWRNRERSLDLYPAGVSEHSPASSAKRAHPGSAGTGSWNTGFRSVDHQADPFRSAGMSITPSRRPANRIAATRSAVVPGLRRCPSARSQQSNAAISCRPTG